MGCVLGSGAAPARAWTAIAVRNDRAGSTRGETAMRWTEQSLPLDASHLPGDGTPGRRHRPGAVAGGPSAGRGTADPARVRARSISAWRTEGRAARRSTTRRSRRSPPPGWRSSIRRPRPRRAPTRSCGGGSSCRSSTGRSTRFPACRPTSAASSTSTSCGSPPAGPTTTPAG